MNSPATHAVLSSPAIDPRVLNGRPLVVRQGLQKSGRTGGNRQEGDDGSDSDADDVSDSLHDSPSWSTTGGHREGSFKKRPPPTPNGTPMMGLSERSFLSPSVIARQMATVEIGPASGAPGFKAVEGKERKKRLSGLTALSEAK